MKEYASRQTFGGLDLFAGRKSERQSTRRKTSDESYAESNLSANRRVMLDLISEKPRTCDEIMALGYAHQSASASINWLMRRGLIVDGGERRETRAGRSAIVWTASATPRPIANARPTRRELEKRINEALDALRRDVVLESLCRLPIAILKGECTNA
jgi:hypothetical protein